MLRYAGYCYDSESGLYYLSARHYDPATRQFLSKDLSRNDGEQSAYQYCLGNPVGLVDPTGYRPTLDGDRETEAALLKWWNVRNRAEARRLSQNRPPTGGSEWVYGSAAWNKEYNLLANCYLYAVLKLVLLDTPRGDPHAGMQPGDLARARGTSIAPASSTDVEGLLANVEADLRILGGSITPCEAGTRPPTGSRKVALAIAPKVPGFDGDYHWFEQNTDGVFSGKSGTGLPVSERDGDHSLLYDPERQSLDFDFGDSGHISYVFEHYYLITGTSPVGRSSVPECFGYKWFDR